MKKDPQDDFFNKTKEKEPLTKLENQSISSMSYQGQIIDRQTEPNYETINQMEVCLALYSLICDGVV